MTQDIKDFDTFMWYDCKDISGSLSSSGNSSATTSGTAILNNVMNSGTNASIIINNIINSTVDNDMIDTLWLITIKFKESLLIITAIIGSLVINIRYRLITIGFIDGQYVEEQLFNDK